MYQRRIIPAGKYHRKLPLEYGGDIYLEYIAN